MTLITNADGRLFTEAISRRRDTAEARQLTTG